MIVISRTRHLVIIKRRTELQKIQFQTVPKITFGGNAFHQDKKEEKLTSEWRKNKCVNGEITQSKA